MIMLSPATLMNTKCGTVTPVTYNKNNLKVPSRKLWQTESTPTETSGDHWSRYRNLHQDEKWDVIESPQFVDFSNLPGVGDSFFNKVTVIVSTPKPEFENEKLPNTVEDNTLISSLDKFSLSGIECDSADVTIIKNVPAAEEENEQYVVHKSSVQAENKIKAERCNDFKKPQNVAGMPFNLEARQRFKQENKQERINRVLEEEKKMRVFRANPVPKFIKARTTTAQNPTNNNNNNNNDGEKVQACNNGNERAHKPNASEKQVKKSSELWKKPPFIPALSRKNLERPKTPPLYSAARALERKRFDEAIREKERQKEQLRQMELAAKKKQEEEEIARLRKQTVHKAQPIRKYKPGLPEVKKRPLTDPVSPLSLKRRRRV